MVASNQAKHRSLRILCYVVAFALLALIVVAVIVFLIPFLDESSTNRGIVTLFIVLLALISFLIFRKGYYRNRPTVGRQTIFAIIVGLAGGSVAGGFMFGLSRGSVRFPDFLLIVLVAGLVAVMVTLVTYRATKKFGSH